MRKKTERPLFILFSKIVKISCHPFVSIAVIYGYITDHSTIGNAVIHEVILETCFPYSPKPHYIQAILLLSQNLAYIHSQRKYVYNCYLLIPSQTSPLYIHHQNILSVDYQ